ncbi:hypothetical protein WOLCODRAFT_167593 [Wolfiporia cocos MD-104 SS10]|uniref:F-box domain-containing protein n=1 Tax=Wolfiporia cocos (strain MD-104) TaxID=742152 RepID=A0A2H3JCN2_WOLCO|nr:hypothetical protein WOLCODRAFT_167593 [Wolfiporia cocos MD-104 SS10]
MTQFICTSVTPEGHNDAVQAFPAAYPLEVEYEILYHLRDQRRLLIVCNAVCRAWRAEIRPYLFHTVRFRRSDVIRWPLQDEDSILFLELIQQSPDIPQYVRRLVLEGSTRYWIEILSQLRSLEDLTITSSTTDGQPVVQSLENMVRYRESLPPIKHLRLHNLRFDYKMTSTLPQFLLGFPKVSTLILQHVRSGMNEDTPPAREILPELENLTMEHSESWAAEWMLHDCPDMRLRNISLVWLDDVEDLFLYQDLLNRSGMMTPEHSAVFMTFIGLPSINEGHQGAHLVEHTARLSSLFAFPDPAQLMQATFSLLNELKQCLGQYIEMEVWTKDIDTLHSMFDWEDLARTIAKLFCYPEDESYDFTFTLIHRLSSGQRDLPPELLEAPLREYLSRERVERIQFWLILSCTIVFFKDQQGNAVRAFNPEVAAKSATEVAPASQDEKIGVLN